MVKLTAHQVLDLLPATVHVWLADFWPGEMKTKADYQSCSLFDIQHYGWVLSVSTEETDFHKTFF